MNRLCEFYQYESKTEYWVREKFPGAKPILNVTPCVMEKGKVPLPKPYDNTNYFEIVEI